MCQGASDLEHDTSLTGALLIILWPWWQSQGLCSVPLSGSQGCPGIFIIRSSEAGQPNCVALLPGCPDEDPVIYSAHAPMTSAWSL